MAISLKDRARLKKLAAELSQIVGGAYRADGSHKSFDEIESEAIEMTDLLAAAVMQQAVDVERPEGCRCPSCNTVVKLADDDREAIVLQTDRGEVDWMTVEYFCRRCRRSFFPSASRLGTSRGSHGQSTS